MNKKNRKYLLGTFFLASGLCFYTGAVALLGNTASVNAKAETPVISLEEGAACRIRTAEDEDSRSGLRFTANLDASQWGTLTAAYEMSAGIIIVPTDYIKKAGGYTHDALFAAGLSFIDAEYTETELGTDTNFAASVVNILDTNYTRDFSGIAYVKSNTEIEGYTAYNGSWYLYTEYSEENNSRNVYEIAQKAYNDRKVAETTAYANAVIYNGSTSYSPYLDSQREVLKGYVDSVIDIRKDAWGDISVQNNSQYYTSPYTPFEVNEGEWLIDGADTAKGMLYGGERRTEFTSFTDNCTNLSFAMSKEATFNAKGSVTLEGKDFTGAQWTYNIASTLNNSYVALKGKYTIGNYVDITFTGNNMPHVMFFADQINGVMTSDGGNGLLISNGMYSSNFKTSYNSSKLVVNGPNRIENKGSDSTLRTTYEGSNIVAKVSSTDYPLLTQSGLTDSTDTYKYTVGTYLDENGKIVVDILLYNITTSAQVYDLQMTTTLTESDVTAGSIILYDGVKGLGTTTTFSYSEAYIPVDEEVVLPESNGATFNEDGSVTLEAEQYEGNYTSHMTQAFGLSSKGDISYVALAGEYGVGTYVTTSFIGLNMPNVMFFADRINGDMTEQGGKGLLLCGAVQSAGLRGANKLSIYGPNRIGAIYDANSGLTQSGIGSAKYGYIYHDADNKIGYFAETYLTRAGLLADTTGRTYTYTVGTYLNGNGNIVVHVIMTAPASGDLEAVDYDVTYTTSLTESDVTAGSIVLYAGVQGSDYTTTFSYDEPVLGLLNNGATFNEDGSVTLEAEQYEGNYTSHMTQAFGLSSKGDISYVALAGEYGVGTYVTTSFIGLNMPNVMFFADRINGDMTEQGGKGLLLCGAVQSAGLRGANKLSIYGPNRIGAIYDANSGLTQSGIGSAKYGYIYHDADNKIGYFAETYLTRAGLLADTTGRTYTYTVGTYLNGNGNIVVHVIMTAPASGDLEAVNYDVTSTTGLTESDVTAGNIVLYAGVQGSDYTTTFSYSEAYIPEVENSLPFSKGAMLNSDGSVTLDGTQFTGAQWTYNIAQLNNNYVALKGDYGIGTYLDILFTGNNMPHVMFFADQINGIMTSDGGKGLLLSNGLYSSNFAQNMGYDNLFVHGPTRILNNGSGSEVRDTYASYVGDGGVVASVAYGKYPLLTQKGLVDSTDTYKYTVGTYLDGSGKLVVDILLYNVTTSATVYDLQLTTTLTEKEITAGNIILYDGVKCSDTTTTFTYSFNEEISYYAYAAPGAQYDELRTLEDFQTYAASGLDALLLSGNNSFYGTDMTWSADNQAAWKEANQTAWDASAAKQAFNLAKQAGIEKIILRDDRLYIKLFDANFSRSGRDENARASLIGSGCMFATEAELDAYVAACMAPYIHNELLYGIGLMDEPESENVLVYGQLYRSIKRVAKQVYGKDIYIQMNLLPLDEGGAWDKYCDNYQDLTLEEAYREYLVSYIEATGVEELSIDYYPFKPTNGGRFVNGFYSCLQIYAEVCQEYGVEASFVLQTFEYVHSGDLSVLNGYRKLTDVREMYLQMNSALGFGMQDIGFYAYEVKPSDDVKTVLGETLYFDGDYYWTADGSFITPDGTTTDTYSYAQEVLAYTKAVREYLKGYSYNGAAISVSSAASAYESAYKSTSGHTMTDGSVSYVDFEDSDFTCISSVENDKDIMLITELYNEGNDKYMYMVQNVLDPAYESAGNTTEMSVTISFGAEYSQVMVVMNGVASTVDLVNGVYTTTLDLGEAVFLQPIA